MNITTIVQNGLSARLFAGITIVSLLLSAFPVAFFVANAAGVSISPISHDVAAVTTLVSSADTTGLENITLSFTYDAEFLDNSDEFIYGWREAGGSDNQLGSVAGANEGVVGDESGTVTAVALGTGADNLANLEIYFTNTGTATTDETVFVTSISLDGDAIAPAACTGDSFETGDNTDPVQNTDSGEYFTTIQNAIDDCDTVGGHTIEVTAGTYNEAVVVDKSVALHGPNHAISAVTGARVAEAVITEHLRTNVATGVEVSGFEFTGVQTTSFTIYVIGDSEGFTFKNNRFIDNEMVAIKTPETGVAKDLTIEGNLISGVTEFPQSGIFLGGVSGDSVVTGNKIIDTAYGGIVVSTADGLLIADNEIVNVPQQGIQLAIDIGDVTIQNNVITDANTDQVTDKGAIRLYGSDVTGAVLITNNTISGGHNGIAIKDGQDLTGKDITIVDNDVLAPNTGVQIYNGGTGELDAENNWWGVDTGIQSSGGAGTLDADPFLCGSFGSSPAVSVNGSCLPAETATVSATKIVCEYEAELPNWGTNGTGPTVIDATTAAVWLANKKIEDPLTSCRAVTDWEFQWAPSGTSIPGDYNKVTGPAAGWNTFTETVDVPLSAIGKKNLGLREVLQTDYVPFGRNNPVSAEFYCGNDVVGYDNLEYINKPVADETYHCVGFNAEKLGEPGPRVGISTSKIVCDFEGELPNWGAKEVGPAVVTATTATDWLAANSNTSCRLVDDWEFEWSDNSVSAPNSYNSFVGPAAGWNTFSGFTVVPMSALNGGNLEFREVLKPDSLKFGGKKDVSPEFYCGNDGLNYDNLERVNHPEENEIYHCVAWNPLELGNPPVVVSEVTMCKLDQDDNQLAGWTLMLQGDEIGTYQVPANSPAGVDTAVLQGGASHIVLAEGTWDNNRGPLNIVDAEYSTEDNWVSSIMDGFTGFGTDILELFVGGTNGDWGAYNSSHQYVQTYVPGVTGPVNLAINDTNYVDNTGSLNASVFTGFAGITEANGCVTFTDVPYGDYQVAELKQDGWRNLSGLVSVTVDDETHQFDVVNTDALPPLVTSCSFVSDIALKNTPSQSNVAGNLTSFALNDNLYTSGDEFDLFVSGDTNADAPYKDEVVMERTADGLRVFFYGTGKSGPVTEFSGSFKLNGVDLSNVMIKADSQPNEANGAWPDRFAVDPTTGEVTFTLYTNSSNDSFVISGLTQDCGIITPDPDPTPITISGTKSTITDGQTAVLASGWVMELKDENGLVVATTSTGADGAYSFSEAPGIYEVHEVMQSPFTQFSVTALGGTTNTGNLAEYCEFNTMPLLATDDNNDDSSYQNLDSRVYSCDFVNQTTTTGGEVDNGPGEVDLTPQRTSRSTGGGTRIASRTLAAPTPAPLVLGAATSQCPFLVDYMQMGASNDPMEVMKLQLFLNIFKDMFGGTENPVTGTFGATTDANVKALQTHFKTEILDPWYNLGIVPHNRPTGFVYKTTLWKINSIVCPDYAVLPEFAGETLNSNTDIDAAPIKD